jgi:hypothetical protein
VPALNSKPELFEDLIPVWNAFQELSVGRHYSMAGPSGLTSSEITAWLDLEEINDGDTRRFFHRMIRAMDASFLHHVHSKNQ